jgi:hypothetical protein
MFRSEHLFIFIRRISLDLPLQEFAGFGLGKAPQKAQKSYPQFIHRCKKLSTKIKKLSTKTKKIIHNFANA